MGGLTNDIRQFWWPVLAIVLLTIVTRLPSLLRTSEGVIYRMHSSRGASGKSAGAENNRATSISFNMDLPVGISTLQHTDRWIGVPLCAILTLLRKIIEAASADPAAATRFSSSSSRNRAPPSSLILRSVARREWLDARTSTSSCLRTIASSST